MTLSNLERYERIAWVYDLLDLPFEYGRYRRIRPLLFRDLSGRILDAGVGTGRNFPFYPPGADVVGIDLSPAMLARAERRRPSASRVVRPGGIIRCLEYTRPSGGLRRAMTRLWEPWVFWAYGAGFDRQTEKHVPEAGLQLIEARFVADELIKLLGARA